MLVVAHRSSGMSDQGTGHESGAKVGTAPVHPRDQMVGDVGFRVLMSGLKSLWDRPCPPHDQMVAKTSRTTMHNDRGRITFSFPLYPGLLVSLFSTLEAYFFSFSYGHGERKGARKKTREGQGPVRVDLVYLVWDTSIHMQGFPRGLPG